jgi:hypothetical protein
MSRFIPAKEDVNLDSDGKNNFPQSLNTLELKHHKLLTMKKEKVWVDVLCTDEEYQKVQDVKWSIGNKLSNVIFDSTCISGDYKDALQKLLFTKFYEMFKTRELDLEEYFSSPYYDAYGPPEAFILDEFLHTHTYDELAIFTKLFKELFKGIK